MKQATMTDDYRALLVADNTIDPYQLCGTLLGKVVSVYDGDTCRVAIIPPRLNRDRRPPFTVAQYLTVRLLGYDAPEMEGESHDYGAEVRDTLRALVLNRIVVLDIPLTRKCDPYGRTLGHVHVPTATNLNGAPCLPWRTAWRADPGRKQATPMLGQSVSVLIRGQYVAVPVTRDTPSAGSDWSEYIHVNQWMVEHARVKPYCGGGRRPEWTAEELAIGIT